jgi:hypothetical protein
MTTHIYMLSIPISNYTGDEIFEKKFYFNSKPNREQVIDLCTRLIREFEYKDFDTEQARDMILHIGKDNFPCLRSGQVLHSIPITHPKFGDCSICLERVYVY